MNPFITLTRIKDKGLVRININHIVAYEQKTCSDSPRKYTYILIVGGGHSACSRNVKETPEEVDDMISYASLSIPFTHIKGA